MTRNALRGVALLSALLTMAGLALPAAAKVGDVSTYFSKAYAGDGGDANSAFLDNPQGFVADASCNLYVADTANFVVRKITTSNVITTYAGSGQYGTLASTLTKSKLKTPSDIALGPSGEFYVTDSEGNTVRKLTTGASVWLTGLKAPLGVTVNGGFAYVSDTGRNRILKVNLATKATTTFASLSSPGKMTVLNSTLYVMGSGSTKLYAIDLNSPVVLTLKSGLQDAEGVTTYNGLVYFVTGTNGTMNQLWQYDPGNGSFTLLQDVAETEWYNHNTDLLFCGGKLYMLFKSGSSIFTMDTNGANPVKLAGAHRWNDVNGALGQALTGRPAAMALSPDKKTVYLVENNKIKAMNLKTKTLTYLAGHANDNYVDGIGEIARLSGVEQIAISPKGSTLYLADRNNNRIRVFNIKTKSLTTLTGAGNVNQFNGVANAYAEGSPCTTTSKGVAGCAYFDRPTGIALSLDGKTLYVADSFNHVIRTVSTATGKTKILAGSTKAGYRDGAALSARFLRPTSLLMSTDGKTLYIVDQSAHAIYGLNLKTKKVTRLMGTGKAGYRDGTWKQAVLSYPTMLAQGPGNTLLLTEIGSNTVRQINVAKKTISRLAGSGQRGNLDGSQTKATFNTPRGVLMVSPTTAFVADQLNDKIRSVKLR